MIGNYSDLLIGFGSGVLVCVILYLLLKRSKVPGPRSLPKPQARAIPANQELIGRLRQNLRLKVLYDEDKIDRLIDFERHRNPKGSEADLMQSAIERWERQNR
jgi:hypothetical protein